MPGGNEFIHFRCTFVGEVDRVDLEQHDQEAHLTGGDPGKESLRHRAARGPALGDTSLLTPRLDLCY